MLPAIVLFAATYVLMLTFSKYRPYIALASGVIFIVSGMLPFDQIIGALDFNVLLMMSVKFLSMEKKSDVSAADPIRRITI